MIYICGLYNIRITMINYNLLNPEIIVRQMCKIRLAGISVRRLHLNKIKHYSILLSDRAHICMTWGHNLIHAWRL